MTPSVVKTGKAPPLVLPVIACVAGFSAKKQTPEENRGHIGRKDASRSLLIFVAPVRKSLSAFFPSARYWLRKRRDCSGIPAGSYGCRYDRQWQPAFRR